MDPQQQVERYLRSDVENTDIFSKLKVNDPYKKGRTTFSGLAEQDYPRHDQFGVPILSHAWHHSFPQELQDQFRHMQNYFATGLLASINRAWMSIDSDLYLWNFENNRDLAYYDAINNTIMHVDVVGPKPGFSYPSLHSILIVATTVDILLIALSFQDSSGRSLLQDCMDLKNATILMVGGAPLYRLHLDGLIVSDICPTLNGRIFFSSDDSLYELEYFEKGWFGAGGTCRKINHSKRLINYLVPVLQIFYTKDSIIQLVVDDSRHLLYVLMKSGCIQLFDLGTDGRGIQKYGALYREQIEHLARESCDVNPELFYEIVKILPVHLSESINVNLIAITSKGVRIYISCLANAISLGNVTQELLRPSGLQVLHIRFPPESPATSVHTMNVYSSHSTHDCLLMATTGAEPNTSVILAHSTSCFTFAPHLVEHTIQQRIRGNVWRIVHVRPKILRKLLPVPNDSIVPLCIEQHISPLEKFFIITSKGIDVFEHFAPLELFRHILTQYGSESKQFQQFLGTLHGREICVMALIVLCSTNAPDQIIRDLALRVFFSHGGEPMLMYGTGEHFMDAAGNKPDGYLANGTLSNASIFLPRTPLRTSTPQSGGIGGIYGSGGGAYTNGHTPSTSHPNTPGLDGDHSIIAGAQVMNSARHEALYTYFSRIVQKVWKRKLCVAQQKNNIYSLLTNNEVDYVSNHLDALKRAIDEHSLVSAPTTHYHSIQIPQRQGAGGESNLVEQEKQSLLKLRAMIGTTCEVLALWGVMLEHELHVIFTMLTPDVQKCLLYWTLEDFVRSNGEIAADLITAIVRFYIGDDATTAAISERLRQLCPTLFTVDDATVVRATENIYRLKASAQPRPEVLQEAVAQLRRSIQKLNLVQTCDLLLQVFYFEGIVDLALTRARRDDPNELALVAYKKHIGTDEGAVNEAIKKRNEAYNCILEVLRLLHTLTHGTPLSTLNLGNVFPSAEFVKSQLSPAQAHVERDKLIEKVLGSDDELASVSIFQWMLANNLADQLITNKFKHFEAFLFHEIEDGKGNIYMELLWKFYEKNQNYLEAAKVLAEMASKGTSRINIGQRITYLSNALMCIQSAVETRENVELKQDISDKLDVAQIQLRTKSLLETDATVDVALRGREVTEMLNYQLCSLTDLYRFAKMFNLHEIKLAVLYCAGKYEEEVIEDIWKDILQKELRAVQPNRPSSLGLAQKNLSSILLRLRRKYESSPKYVPLNFVLRELLLYCFKHTPFNTEWLLEFCRDSGIPYSNFVSIASNQYRILDPFWKQNQRAFQFMLDIALLLTRKCWTEAERLSNTERKVLKNTCLEFLAALQLNLHILRNHPEAGANLAEAMRLWERT